MSYIDQAVAMHRNGYHVTPIAAGSKSPAIAGWRETRLTEDALRMHDAGFGIVCGEVVGIDIDISHPAINAEVVRWLEANVGMTCKRIGAAPRVVMVYRAEQQGLTKGMSAAFFDPSDPVKLDGKENMQKVEILANGQQFVAYAVHPDTQRPYEWVDLFGGPAYVAARELPVISEAQIDELLMFVSMLIRRSNVQVKSQGRMVGSMSAANDLFGLTPRLGITLQEAAAIIVGLDPGESEVWLRVGMALHHEFGDPGWALFDEWSRRAPGKYNERENRKRWESFGKPSSQPVTMGTVKRMASYQRSDEQVQAMRTSLEQIREVIESGQDNTDLTTRVAAEVRKVLSGNHDPGVRAEAFGLFAAKFKAITKTAMPVGDVKRLLIERSVGVRKRRELTEFGVADRFVDRFGDRVMHIQGTPQWHAWSGIYWPRCSETQVEWMVKEVVRDMVREIDDWADDVTGFLEFCRMAQRSRFVQSVIHLLKSEPSISVPASELDKHPHLLGVANGVLDLRTGQLQQPDPSLRITSVMGCAYDPAAQCPVFVETLIAMFSNDAALAQYTLSLLGYSLMGDPKAQLMVVPYGNGANGKSTLFGVMKTLFGDYARHVEPSTFLDKGGSGGGGGGAPREDIVRLRGARFVYVGEPDEFSELREGFVKSMTGGEALPARGLFATQTIEIQPTWVVWMPTNHRPVIKGSDYGIWRRLIPIPFLHNFKTAGTADPDRPQKLNLELPGILALLVRAAMDYQKNGLVEPAAVAQAREGYRESSDVLREWKETFCEVGAQHTEDTHALWLSWDSFAKSRGITQIRSSSMLGRRLDQDFPVHRTTGGKRVRQGIRLRKAVNLFE